MKITKLEIQKHNPDKYNVYVDKKYLFPITINFYLEHTDLIKIGEDISIEQLNHIIELSLPEEVFSQICYLLKYGERSSFEMIEKLKRKNFSEESINIAIQKAIQIGLINDLEYCQNKINIYKSRKYSKRKMIQELYRKGFQKEFVEDLIDDFCDYDFFYNIAYEKALQKLKGIKEKDPYKIKSKLYSYLSYYGFDYDIISCILNEILNNTI